MSRQVPGHPVFRGEEFSEQFPPPLLDIADLNVHSPTRITPVGCTGVIQPAWLDVGGTGAPSGGARWRQYSRDIGGDKSRK